MTTPRPLAHSKNDAGHTHDLREHLERVAELAAGFAAAFGSEQYARCAGLWHDLGKNNPKFQARLRATADAGAEDAHEGGTKERERVGHSAAGAIHALNTFGHGIGRPLAFVIAGHHAGLDDTTSLFDGRLKTTYSQAELTDSAAADVKVIPAVAPPSAPAFLKVVTGTTAQDLKRRYEFWVRMLFSCLVDADFRDTEEHFSPGRAAERGRERADLAALLDLLNLHMSQFDDRVGPVNEVRRLVLASCREQGRLKRNRGDRVFTLTAPTGCGKTLAGMAFALEHAITHRLRRVIVVIPYTSIIDQNAAEYRKVFDKDHDPATGPGNVLEHHASIDSDDPKRENQWNRLAREDWDAPVVVTTSVQFVESLFANRPSRCRKLHNIAESVVIFDEVQTLPVGHLMPIVDVLKELVAHYGVSLVLSTATQPALQHRESGLSHGFPGFHGATELVPDVTAAFAQLKRVDLAFDPGVTEWDALAADIEHEADVLVITHRRMDARELAEKVPGSVHLSALMCPKHRKKVLDHIRSRLGTNQNLRRSRRPVEPLRVVSTQLVEAGVDLDFPVVYRAFAGFDSIAQAAGRCNRNGELKDADGNFVRGRVRVFRAPTKPPVGTLRDATAVAETMLAGNPGLDPLDPKVFDPYFRSLYDGQGLGGTDRARIQTMREGCLFKSVAEAFRMIEDDWSEAVVVPYDAEAEKVLEQLRVVVAAKPDSKTPKAVTAAKAQMRGLLRRLQQYTVTAPKRLVESNAARQTFIADLVGTVNAIDPKFARNLYSERFGLEFKDELALVYDPNELTS